MGELSPPHSANAWDMKLVPGSMRLVSLMSLLTSANSKFLTLAPKFGPRQKQRGLASLMAESLVFLFSPAYSTSCGRELK